MHAAAVGLQHNRKGKHMSRNALIASLAGAIALGFGALGAQAASVPMSDAGLHSGDSALVQKAYYYYRHHHHRHNGYYYYPHYYHHHHHRHHHHRYW
jgi:hypothetical protein